jgi:hypothetical protein
MLTSALRESALPAAAFAAARLATLLIEPRLAARNGPPSHVCAPAPDPGRPSPADRRVLSPVMKR